MSSRTLIKKSDLGNPELVTVPTFEELLQNKISRFREFAPDYAYFLAADPVMKVLRLITLDELFLYLFANDRGLATTLTHSIGTDLDAVGQFYGVTRLIIQEADPDANPPKLQIEEDDERYRGRIADGIVAFSAGGTPSHYSFHAKTSDPRVRDVVVYSPDLPNFLNMGGRVAVTILSTEDNGVPALDLLAIVRAYLNRKDVKCLNDILEIEPAAIRSVDVVADIVLERGSAPDIMLQLETKLRADFAEKQALGWDAPKSWFVKELSQDGVYEVSLVSPSTGFTIRPNQFPALNSVTLRFAGLATNDDWDVDELTQARLLREVYEKYISYAVQTKRTRVQIQDDLIPVMRVGIVQPSMEGVAGYLGLTQIKTAAGDMLPADEVAIIIHYTLSKYYERGYYTTV